MTYPESTTDVPDLYLHATAFDELFRETAWASDQQEQLHERMTALNEACELRDTGLIVASLHNRVDWTLGEWLRPLSELPEATGVFVGLFVGYIALPTTLEGTEREQMVLSTVLKATCYDPGIDQSADIAVVTPIPSARIERLNA